MLLRDVGDVRKDDRESDCEDPGHGDDSKVPPGEGGENPGQSKIGVRLCQLTFSFTRSPWADLHQRDGCAREEDREQQEGFAAPNVRQGPDEGGAEKRQQALRMGEKNGKTNR